jgi:hypothetical protein
MTAKDQNTPQERTFYHLVEEGWESLSEAAQDVVGQTLLLAYHEHLIDSRIYVPQENKDEHMKTMRHAASELTEHDCEGLTKIWRSALAAAASVDPYDYETLVGGRSTQRIFIDSTGWCLPRWKRSSGRSGTQSSKRRCSQNMNQ